VDVVVRRATESDIPQVVGFTRDTFTWGDYVPRVINKWVKDGTAYVALINEEVIGVVNLVLLPTGVAWLEGIRVKPTYRRRGVGTALTNYVLNLARVKGARYAMLMIAEWNNASHGLALKLGFKPILNVHGGVVKESTLSCGNPAGLPGYGTMFTGCMPSGWRYSFPPPSFNSTAGVQALEVLRELVAYEPSPSVMPIGYTALSQLIEGGSVAGAVAWANDIMGLNSSVASQLLMAPLPGGYGEPGSTFLGISKYSQHKRLALEFLQFVMSPQFQ